MLRRVSVSSVKRLAAISGRAAFLAPPIVILPASGRLPRMRILSMKKPLQCAPRSIPGRRLPARRNHPQTTPCASTTIRRNWLEFRQRHAALPHIFSLAIGVGGLAWLLAAEEEELADPLAGIDLGRQWRRVRDLDGDVTFPFRLERRHVDDDAAARIGRLAETDHQ